LWGSNAGFMVVKPAQLQWSGFSCGKKRCNGSVRVPTLTQNRSSGLEPLLILARSTATSKTSFTPTCKARSTVTSKANFTPICKVGSTATNLLPVNPDSQRSESEHVRAMRQSMSEVAKWIYQSCVSERISGESEHVREGVGASMSELWEWACWSHESQSVCLSE
jgi:hypothetical protein